MMDKTKTNELFDFTEYPRRKIVADRVRSTNFYKGLIDGRFGISVSRYVLYTLLSGGAIAMLYLNTFPNPLILAAIFLNGAVLPYVIIKQRYSKQTMQEAMMFKEFLELLVSEFVIGSTTSQAIEHLSLRERLPKEVGKAFLRMHRNINLGSGVMDVLMNEKDNPDASKDFKVVLSVLIINHESGAQDTIRGLDSVGQQMDDRMDNIIDLKKAIVGINGQRYVFFFMILFLPLYLGNSRDGFYSYVLENALGAGIVVGSFLVSFVGQLILDSVITKTINKF